METELKPGTLVHFKKTLLKVSLVYPDYITALVLMEDDRIPQGSEVRRYTKKQLRRLKPASREMLSTYHTLQEVQ